MSEDASRRHDLAAQHVSVSELRPWSRNPRRNDDAAERLAYTIATHGWTTPLLVQASSKRIIGGHTRLKAAIKLGLDTVPCVFHEGGRVSGTNRTGNQGWRGCDVAFEDGIALPSNVVDIPNNSANHDAAHSAAFPAALPSFFIRAFSDDGDAIFDPFLGSGTTLIAAAKHGRVGYGCEISAHYCDVIRRRWTTWAEQAGQDPGPGALRG
jgi:hypothetical protein